MITSKSSPTNRPDAYSSPFRRPSPNRTARSSDSAALVGYRLGEELGSGGFGKVKLATHLLTGEKVAIKIIDKKAIGEDLPRVTTELKALKKLSHQNICRLYQVVETEQKYYIVIEYCSGGELFDYIVKKDRLPEPEARHFFRQIVASLAYVHSHGFAHRDLKPENLLLTDDLQLKLIDFGLCANPEQGLGKVLETCCGSPAYAAPELINGAAYHGNAADVWSMGVLLYTLLCGCLPFEHDNIQKLYMKVISGKYEEPSFLTSDAKEILRAMLQTDPVRRIKVDKLITQSWLCKDYPRLRWKSIYDNRIVDDDCAREMARYYRIPLEDMETRIKRWDYDDRTATYFLLLHRKKKGHPVVLPPNTRHFNGPDATLDANGNANLLNSPTIHASLDLGLNKSGLEDADDDSNPFEEAFTNVDPDQFFRQLSSKENTLQKSYMFAIEAGARGGGDADVGGSDLTSSDTSTSDKSSSSVGAVVQKSPKSAGDLGNAKDKALFLSPQITLRPPPQNRRNVDDRVARTAPANKENIVPKLRDGVRVNPRPTKNSGDGGPIRPKSVYYQTPVKTIVTPARSGVKALSPIPPHWSQQTPVSKQSRAKSSERVSPRSVSPRGQVGTPPSAGSVRTPRSASKTPKTPRPLSRRVFRSVERKVDKVRNMLTPRKTSSRSDSAQKMPKKAKTLINVSTTSSNDPNLVKDELLSAFERKGITCETEGWCVKGKRKDSVGRTTVQFELEVVWIEQLNLIGIRRKRLTGDAFQYKKVCEEILRMAGL